MLWGGLRWWCLAVCVLSCQAVWACAICAPSAAEQTLTQRLFKSQAIAIGTALASEGQYRVTASVRAAEGEAVLTDVGLADAVAPPADGSSVLLARSGGSWRVMAALPVQRAAWVRQLEALRRPADANPADADWAQRFAFFAPDLESPVAAVAQVAYEELSLAPLGAMRAAAAHFVKRPLAQWLSQPELAHRHPLYALMLGFVSTPDQGPMVRQRILNHSGAAPLATASAWMAALVEMQGQDGVEWLTRHYLQDATRSDAEVQAALLALRVHAADGARIGKPAATQALRAFVQANPQRAGFAASDLGDWAQWDFVADFVQLLDTDRPQVFASRYAMVLYLLRNPQPQAQAALQRLRAAGRI